MVPNCLDNFVERFVCRLLWCEQVSDELIGPSSDDTEKDGALLSSGGDIVGDEILLEPFNVGLPGFLIVLKFSDGAVSSHVAKVSLSPM